MSDLPIMVRAIDCTPSPTNVRKRSDPIADAVLEASIAENGIIQNLIGVPVARKKGKYRIVAGGRRLACVLRLIEKGIFSEDYQIPVLVLSDAANEVSISLIENFFTLAMNPAEACRAFQDIIEIERKTPVEVAKRLGVTETFVLGRLRLANLAEPIFTALADGEITLDVAKAYASTSDPERQATVYAVMARDRYYASNVNEIRRQLASYSYMATNPKALLVGRDAYVGAGGRIEGDLFTDTSSERWLDTHIVDALVAERLAKAAETIRASEGYGEIRVVPSTEVPWTETQRMVPVRGEIVPFSDEETARYEQLQTEIEDLYQTEIDEDDPAAVEAYSTKLEALENEFSALGERPMVVTDEQKAGAIAYLVVGHDGQPRLSAQLYAEPAAMGEETGQDDPDDGEPDTQGQLTVAPRPKMSQRLIDELATMKTELLAVHIASNPAFALDLGTFILVEKAELLYSWGMPSELRASAPPSRVSGFESGTLAAERWTELDAGLDRSWTEAETVELRYDAFCALAPEARAAWFAWAVARTFQAVPHGEKGEGFIDHLGTGLAIDVASWWRPTARTYFDRISRAQILSLIETVGGPELRQRYSGEKKHDLAASAEKIFAGGTILDADVREQFLRWLPEQMLFGAQAAEADREAAIDDAPNDDDLSVPATEHDPAAAANDGADDLSVAA